MRFSSIFYGLAFFASIGFVGWKESERFWHSPSWHLYQIQQKHGVSLRVVGGIAEGNESYFAQQADVSLGSQGSGSLEKIRFQGGVLKVTSAHWQLFDDKPFSWLQEFCGTGSEVQISIESLNIKTPQKSYHIPNLVLTKEANGGVRGVGEQSEIYQDLQGHYTATGRLLKELPFMEALESCEFLTVKVSENARESDGLGRVDWDVLSLQTLLYTSKEPLRGVLAWDKDRALCQFSEDQVSWRIQVREKEVSLEIDIRKNQLLLKGVIHKDKEKWVIISEDIGSLGPHSKQLLKDYDLSLFSKKLRLELQLDKASQTLYCFDFQTGLSTVIKRKLP